MRILLAEDDELLGDGIRAWLQGKGYSIDWVKDGKAALRFIKSEEIDVVVLDLGLPELSGLQVLKRMRDSGISTPVLILTARDTSEDIIKGFDTGADIYVTKPIDLNVLLAHIRALQRRSAGRATPNIIYGPIELDPFAKTASCHGEFINISRREFSLLQLLLDNAGRALSREYLTQTLYGWGEEIDSNTLEVHIHNIRKKLNGNYIKTIRGVGYMAISLDKLPKTPPKK